MGFNLRDQSTLVLLFVIVLGLGAGLMYYVLLKPLQEEINQISQESENLQRQIEQMQAIERKLPQYVREIEAQKQRLAELRSALPDEKETAAIIRQVQEYAVASNVRIKNFRPQETISREFYTEWPIQMDFDGSFNNLGAFFEKISRHARIINVANLSIKRIPDSEDSARTLNANCTSTTFVYK